jgi:hypothetical protein
MGLGQRTRLRNGNLGKYELRIMKDETIVRSKNLKIMAFN